jgi:DNA (cytosine-5)-methyltransferase 1
MSKRPTLLDLFSGAGGCAVGYDRAGFDVTGVDIVPQPRYPFRHIVADALTFPLNGFDVIHASPPCQKYSVMRNVWQDREYPDLIAPIRERLRATGTPYVIENVVGAPLQNAVLLCASMFGLGTYRHRLFETYPLLCFSPRACHHYARTAPQGRAAALGQFITVTGHFNGLHNGLHAMGIDWMATRDEVAQAIPPAYTEWLGRQLLAVLAYEEVS